MDLCCALIQQPPLFGRWVLMWTGGTVSEVLYERIFALQLQVCRCQVFLELGHLGVVQRLLEQVLDYSEILAEIVLHKRHNPEAGVHGTVQVLMHFL